MSRPCSICADAVLKIAVTKLRLDGASIRDISARVKRPKSTVHYHFKQCMDEQPQKTGAGVREKTKAPRASIVGQSDRCSACGTAFNATEPQAILKRAERIVAVGEAVMLTAQAEGDWRLALQGIDRARSAMELLMKAHGMLRTDADAKAGTVNIFAGLQLHELLELRAALRGSAETPVIPSSEPRIHPKF